jgi:Gpi18-like mannosyltransferase
LKIEAPSPLKKLNPDLLVVLLSLLVQIPIAIFLGHYYDQRVFMATGYLVGSGMDPYQQLDNLGIFFHPLFQEIPRFGYPPLSAFLMGLAYETSRSIVPDLFLYNFTLKLPVIAANILLAFLMRRIILQSGAEKKKSQFAFLFLLFNPFILLITSAWGQIDSISALLCIASLYLVSKGKLGWCALTMALSFAVKPITLPLLGLPLFFPKSKQWQDNSKYMIILFVLIFSLVVLPFLIWNWQPLREFGEWNAHFKSAGGMSPFGIGEIFNNTLQLPEVIEILGFLWFPALLLGYYAIYRNPPNSQIELFKKAMILVMLFFLTRTWLSEPNLILLLPLMLVVLASEKITFRNFHFAWILPFIFMFFNYSFPQLFFLPYPNVLSELAQLDTQILTARLIGRFIVVVVWQIFAWNFLLRKTLNLPAKKKIDSKENFPLNSLQQKPTFQNSD